MKIGVSIQVKSAITERENSKNNYHIFNYSLKITSELLTFMWITRMDRAFVWIIPRFTLGRQETFYSYAGYKTDPIFSFYLESILSNADAAR